MAVKLGKAISVTSSFELRAGLDMVGPFYFSHILDWNTVASQRQIILSLCGFTSRTCIKVKSPGILK